MSPIHRVVRSLKLNDTERLDIVREDGTDRVILSLVEQRKQVQQRTAIYLTLKQANKLARDLAGISVHAYDPADDT